jgi:hypothetical protein
MLGELEEFHPWIYALAGGMFVYIGLADMVRCARVDVTRSDSLIF